MEAPAVRWERYVNLLDRGLVTASEVTGELLDLLADAGDANAVWASMPESLRRQVRAFISDVGAANVPRAWVIGVNDPEWQARQTARRQATAKKLLAEFAEQADGPERPVAAVFDNG